MGLAAYWQQRADRRALRRAPPARGFALEPEPLALGLYARGRQIAAGSFHLAGAGLDSHDPFAAPPPSAGFEAELHGWGWLDHLAACGDAAARTEARRWLADWIARHTQGPALGRGPAWRPDLTGRRVTRWLMHALMLTAGAEPAQIGAILTALGMQADHLRRNHARAAPGLPRIEALTGWVHAVLMLRGFEDQVSPALAALTVQAEGLIGPDGGIASRCPEDLLAILTHLGWCSQLAARAGQPLPQALLRARARAALAVRVLRHADGGMARFHGGGAGPEGLADRALAEAGPAPPPRPPRPGPGPRWASNGWRAGAPR